VDGCGLVWVIPFQFIVSSFSLGGWSYADGKCFGRTVVAAAGFFCCVVGATSGSGCLFLSSGSLSSTIGTLSGAAGLWLSSSPSFSTVGTLRGVVPGGAIRVRLKSNVLLSWDHADSFGFYRKLWRRLSVSSACGNSLSQRWSGKSLLTLHSSAMK